MLRFRDENGPVPDLKLLFTKTKMCPFQHVIAMDANQYLVTSAAKPCNETKNRSLGYIPMECSRVRLKTAAGADGADYINASWLPGRHTTAEWSIETRSVADIL